MSQTPESLRQKWNCPSVKSLPTDLVTWPQNQAQHPSYITLPSLGKLIHPPATLTKCPWPLETLLTPVFKYTKAWPVSSFVSTPTLQSNVSMTFLSYIHINILRNFIISIGTRFIYRKMQGTSGVSKKGDQGPLGREKYILKRTEFGRQ